MKNKINYSGCSSSKQTLGFVTLVLVILFSSVAVAQRVSGINSKGTNTHSAHWTHRVELDQFHTLNIVFSVSVQLYTLTFGFGMILYKCCHSESLDWPRHHMYMYDCSHTYITQKKWFST